MIPHFPLVPYANIPDIIPPAFERRFTPRADSQFLLWLSEQTTANIVEIGCADGLTTYQLAVHNPHKVVYAVDIGDTAEMAAMQQKNETPATGEVCKLAVGLPNVQLIIRDSKLVNYADFKDVSMVFIDGNHTYEGVKADTHLAMRALMRSKFDAKFVAWHDYCEGPHPVGWLKVGEYLRAEIDGLFDVFFVPGTSVAFCRVP